MILQLGKKNPPKFAFKGICFLYAVRWFTSAYWLYPIQDFFFKSNFTTEKYNKTNVFFFVVFFYAVQLTVMYEEECVSPKCTVFSNPAWNLLEETALKDDMLQADSWNILENCIFYSGGLMRLIFFFFCFFRAKYLLSSDAAKNCQVNFHLTQRPIRLFDSLESICVANICKSATYSEGSPATEEELMVYLAACRHRNIETPPPNPWLFRVAPQEETL